MKNKRLETAATIILAVVCVGLVFRLAVRVRSVHAGAPPLQAPRLEGKAGAVRAASRPLAALFAPRKTEAFPDGPVLNLALYQRIESQALVAPERNPFTFEPTAQAIEQRTQAQAAAQAASAQPPAPPPPPPLPFKAIGYSMAAEGKMEGYLTDSQQVYSLHEGEAFDKNYQVVRITPALIEIQDDLFHRTVELPFPQ